MTYCFPLSERMASTFNLPMISHYCAHGAASDKTLYKTFARTRPPATIVSKSLASLLLKFNWTRVAFFRPMSSNLNAGVVDIDNNLGRQHNQNSMNSQSNGKNTPGDYEDIAISVLQMFKESRIEVRYVYNNFHKIIHQIIQFSFLYTFCIRW